MDLSDVTPISRRIMTLFFVIDVSASMAGSKIGAVNHAMEEVIPEIKQISMSNADAEIKIATLLFSTGTEWLTPAPVSAESYYWTYLDADGNTDLHLACNELDKKLAKGWFMSSSSGSYAPVIFLLSDGDPTEPDLYEDSLNKLKQNPYFKRAIKVAVAIGDDAKYDVLTEFTGTPESVIEVHNPSDLKSG